MNERDRQQLDDLVRRGKSGDREAAAAAVGLVWGRMSGIAFGICCDRDLAQDAAQEACARVLTHLSQLRDAGAFVAWADRVTTRASLDALRWTRSGRARENALRAQLTTAEVRDESEEHARQVAILGALEHLPPQQRAVIVLFYWLDKPIGEIAAVLGCEPGTIKSRLARGRAHLAAVLREDILNA
jgi:RNA polymerase sigma-70 factor, ECF subfamily